MSTKTAKKPQSKARSNVAAAREIKSLAKAVASAPSPTALSWATERLVEASKQRDGVLTMHERITPDLAKALLEMNHDNRPLRIGKMKLFSTDIAEGRWNGMNGETIKVANTGDLNDGQHRLAAVIDANKAIDALVVWGVERDSRLTVDTGSTRTVGDFLGVEGVKNANNAAAVAKLLLMYNRGLYMSGGWGGSSKGGGFVVTKQQVQQTYWDNQKRIDQAIDLVGLQPFARKHGVTPIATAFVILSQLRPQKAEEFVLSYCEGADLRKGDAVLALRSKMIAISSERWRAHEKLEIILRHWNFWRKGQDVTKALPRIGAYPKLED